MRNRSDSFPFWESMTYHYLKEFLKPVFFLVFLIASGSFGYYSIEHWEWIDSIYMTVITITTVGFSEVHELSQNGKIFTMFLIIGGVFFYGLAISGFLQIFLELRFRDFMESARLNQKIKKMKNHIIICGGGRMAFTMAKEFERLNIPFIIIENNSESEMSHAPKNWPILMKDALEEETLLDANIKMAKGLASVLPTDADNLFVVLSARKLNPKIRIETRISKSNSREKMVQAGADKVVSPYEAGGIQMVRSMMNPEVDDLMEIVMGKANYEFEMKVTHIDENCKHLGKAIKDTDFRDQGYIVVAVRFPDGEMIFAPKSNFVLKYGHDVFQIGPGVKIE